MFQPNLMEGVGLHPFEIMPQNTSESDVPRIRDDDFDSATKSCSENHDGGGAASGEDQEPRPKKKRYHRHTQHQIQEMEA